MTWIQIDTEFNNPNLRICPPRRLLYPIHYECPEFFIKLERIPMATIRNDCRRDLPEVQGNWNLMHTWILNIWKALWNPCWLLLRPNGKYGIMHGHHRMRLFDAMNADYVWCYVTNKKIGTKKLPASIVKRMRVNDKPPTLGSRTGRCPKCGKDVRFKKVTHNKLFDVRMMCPACGADDIYPYPERL